MKEKSMSPVIRISDRSISSPEMISTVTIKRPLIINLISPDYSTIYRNDSFSPNASNITVHINDANIGNAYNATVRFYNSSEMIGTCQTNQTGFCSIVYNPYDTITPSVRTIYINATKDGSEDSATNTTQITVKGILYINITSPS